MGLAHICDGASEQGLRSGLNTLVVWNNQITYESMIALGRALVRCRLFCSYYCIVYAGLQCFDAVGWVSGRASAGVVIFWSEVQIAFIWFS